MDALKNLKPRMRGVLHEIAFFISLVTGPLLVVLARPNARLAVGIYSAAITAMFGASALYHRPNWRPDIRKWLARLDHSMIFILIAGTFTPIGYILRESLWARVMLGVVWGAAAIGAIIQMIPLKLPKPVIVVPYLLLGWLGMFIMPATYRTAGLPPLVLLLAGGVLYSAGAVAYARRSPNPFPGIFGYHEVFHAFVVVAVVCHYLAVALVVT